MDIQFGPDRVSVSNGSFRVNATEPTYGAYLTYDGIDGSTNSNYGLNLDITGGGTNDRIRVMVSSVTGTFTIFMWIGEGLNDGYTTQRTISTAGAHDFLFEDLSLTYESDGVDLTAVRQVSATISGFSVGESVAIDSITFTGDAAPPDPGDPNAGVIAALERKIKRKIKKAKRKLKKAKKRKKKSKIKRSKRSIRKLKVRLRRL